MKEYRVDDRKLQTVDENRPRPWPFRVYLRALVAKDFTSSHKEKEVRSYVAHKDLNAFIFLYN